MDTFASDICGTIYSLNVAIMTIKLGTYSDQQNGSRLAARQLVFINYLSMTISYYR